MIKLYMKRKVVMLLMNDELLITRILEGDNEEYRHLMEKYHNELFKYVYNLVDNYQDTEDLLQEIFFRIYKNLNKFNSSKASFRTWIYRIAKNYTLNFLTKKSNKMNRNALEYDDSINKSNDDVESNAINKERIDLILQAMRRVLKPKHFEIMSLYYFSDLTVKEISETMNIPDKTIYKAINTSIEKIKKEVE